MRNRFDRELEHLHIEMIEMGALIEQAIDNSVTCLIAYDQELAKQTVAFDEEVNLKEKSIESRCLRLLLQQQPVAADLRLISCALKMITDMERIGDQARDIAALSMRLDSDTRSMQFIHIPQMAQAAKSMVKQSIDAYIHHDLHMAKDVILADDEIDKLFLTVKNELIELLRNDREQGALAIDLLMIAKYFERIGDHATNIAEWVVYSITGQHKSIGEMR